MKISHIRYRIAPTPPADHPPPSLNDINHIHVPPLPSDSGRYDTCCLHVVQTVCVHGVCVTVCLCVGYIDH